MCTLGGGAYFVSDRLYVSAALGRGPWEDPDFHGFFCSLPLRGSEECALEPGEGHYFSDALASLLSISTNI